MSDYLKANPPSNWPEFDEMAAFDLVLMFKRFIMSDQGMDYLDNSYFIESNFVPLNWKDMVFAHTFNGYDMPTPIYWTKGGEASVLMPLTINQED